MFENSVSIIELNAALNAYCRADGVYHVKQRFNRLQSFEHIMVYDKIKDEMPLITPKIGNVLQKGETGRFNPPKTFKFEANILKVKPWKVDFSLVPADHHQSYLARKEKPGSLFSQSWLFETYLTGMVVDSAADNIEYAIWQGQFDPALAADGVANPLTVSDGFLKLVADNAAKCNVAVTGAITEANAVDAFRSVWKKVPYMVRGEGMKLYCSEPAWDCYKTNYQERFGTLSYNDKYEKKHLDTAGTLLEIVPIRAMGDSSRIIIDPMQILTVGTDLGSDMQRLITRENVENRSISMIMDGKIGVGVAAWYANDTTKLLTINDAL